MNHFPSKLHRDVSFAVLTLAITFSLGCSVFGAQSVEEPGYEVLRADGPFELRRYDSFVVAQTTVSAPLGQAQSIAFDRLFGYISGANVASAKIAMTAPVLSEEVDSEGEEIAMTAPVLSSGNGDGWDVAFVLPSSYTLGTAPVPTNPLVRLVAIPAKTVATVRYSGSRGEKKLREYETELLSWIEAANLEPLSEMRSAGYDPPWTLPPMRRNEVLIDVEPAR